MNKEPVFSEDPQQELFKQFNATLTMNVMAAEAIHNDGTMQIINAIGEVFVNNTHYQIQVAFQPEDLWIPSDKVTVRRDVMS